MFEYIYRMMSTWGQHKKLLTKQTVVYFHIQKTQSNICIYVVVFVSN